MFIYDITFTSAALYNKVDELQKSRLFVSSVLIQPIIYHRLPETANQKTVHTNWALIITSLSYRQRTAARLHSLIKITRGGVAIRLNVVPPETTSVSCCLWLTGTSDRLINPLRRLQRDRHLKHIYILTLCICICVCECVYMFVCLYTLWFPVRRSVFFWRFSAGTQSHFQKERGCPQSCHTHTQTHIILMTSSHGLCV